jgi:hypothetical protein
MLLFLIIAIALIYLTIGIFLCGLWDIDSDNDRFVFGFCLFLWPIFHLALLFIVVYEFGTRLGK